MALHQISFRSSDFQKLIGDISYVCMKYGIPITAINEINSLISSFVRHQSLS